VLNCRSSRRYLRPKTAPAAEARPDNKIPLCTIPVGADAGVAGMPITLMHPQPLTMVMANTGHPRPQLRRAVYIHVSDLTSAYNIDHGRLEEELARVKDDPGNPLETIGSRLGVPTELDANFSQKRLQPPRGGYNLCV
jgi:hypothetical protein